MHGGPWQHCELKGLARQTIIGLEFGLLSFEFLGKVQGKVQKVYLKTVTVTVIMPS